MKQTIESAGFRDETSCLYSRATFSSRWKANFQACLLHNFAWYWRNINGGEMGCISLVGVEKRTGCITALRWPAQSSPRLSIQAWLELQVDQTHYSCRIFLRPMQGSFFFCAYGACRGTKQAQSIYWQSCNELSLEVFLLQDCLALGAIFATTDSVAVIQVLEEDRAPLLFSLVFGEGVINDATSVALLRTVQVTLPICQHRYRKWCLGSTEWDKERCNHQTHPLFGSGIKTFSPHSSLIFCLSLFLHSIYEKIPSRFECP